MTSFHFRRAHFHFFSGRVSIFGHPLSIKNLKTTTPLQKDQVNTTTQSRGNPLKSRYQPHFYIKNQPLKLPTLTPTT